jgi:8-oxo-dGTP diphosphatase
VRALIVDDADDVLLVHFRWEGLSFEGGFWACPGGEVEPGEPPGTALRRELAEELGLEGTTCRVRCGGSPDGSP